MHSESSTFRFESPRQKKLTFTELAMNAQASSHGQLLGASGGSNSPFEAETKKFPNSKIDTETLSFKEKNDCDEFRRVRLQAYLDIQKGLALRTLEDLAHFREFAATNSYHINYSAQMSQSIPEPENSRKRDADQALLSENASTAKSSRISAVLLPSTHTAPLSTSGNPPPREPTQQGPDTVQEAPELTTATQNDDAEDEVDEFDIFTLDYAAACNFRKAHLEEQSFLDAIDVVKDIIRRNEASEGYESTSAHLRLSATLRERSGVSSLDDIISLVQAASAMTAVRETPEFKDAQEKIRGHIRNRRYRNCELVILMAERQQAQAFLTQPAPTLPHPGPDSTQQVSTQQGLTENQNTMLEGFSNLNPRLFDAGGTLSNPPSEKDHARMYAVNPLGSQDSSQSAASQEKAPLPGQTRAPSAENANDSLTGSGQSLDYSLVRQEIVPWHVRTLTGEEVTYIYYRRNCDDFQSLSHPGYTYLNAPRSGNDPRAPQVARKRISDYSFEYLNPFSGNI